MKNLIKIMLFLIMFFAFSQLSAHAQMVESEIDRTYDLEVLFPRIGTPGCPEYPIIRSKSFGPYTVDVIVRAVSAITGDDYLTIDSKPIGDTFYDYFCDTPKMLARGARENTTIAYIPAGKSFDLSVVDTVGIGSGARGIIGIYRANRLVSGNTLPSIECIQFGTSGVIELKKAGVIYLHFNDGIFDDNSGTFLVTINNNTKKVYGSNTGGTDFGFMNPGLYSYTATGLINFNYGGKPVNPSGLMDDESNPGFTRFSGIADDSFVCPGLIAHSLVGRIVSSDIDYSSSRNLKDDFNLVTLPIIENVRDDTKQVVPAKINTYTNDPTSGSGTIATYPKSSSTKETDYPQKIEYKSDTKVGLEYKTIDKQNDGLQDTVYTDRDFDHKTNNSGKIVSVPIMSNSPVRRTLWERIKWFLLNY